MSNSVKIIQSIEYNQKKHRVIKTIQYMKHYPQNEILTQAGVDRVNSHLVSEKTIIATLLSLVWRTCRPAYQCIVVNNPNISNGRLIIHLMVAHNRDKLIFITRFGCESVFPVTISYAYLGSEPTFNEIENILFINQPRPAT